MDTGPLTQGYKLKQKIFKWVVRFWQNLLTLRHAYRAQFPTKNIVLSIDGMYTNRNGQIAPAKVQLSDTQPSSYMLTQKNRTVQELAK